MAIGLNKAVGEAGPFEAEEEKRGRGCCRRREEEVEVTMLVQCAVQVA